MLRKTRHPRRELELSGTPDLGMDADALLGDFTRYFGHTLGRSHLDSQSPFVYQALVLAVRDRLMERWNRTQSAVREADGRQVAYLSLEFLMGRLLRNTLMALDIDSVAAGALHRLGLDLEDICDTERDAGLGNGGLGRLAACFLDSCASLALPVTGYGIRYRYGMFHQRIADGRQIEEPDPWLREGYPWEIERFELAVKVPFGGHTESFVDAEGETRYHWADASHVLAIPYDIPVPGYRNGCVNTLRLWSAAATDEFNLGEFNAGDYADAVAEKNAAENITMVLYPNAETENGRELRLRQQYFLASASLQDMLRDWQSTHGDDFTEFADRRCVQLNDTHPAIAVPELMRLLMDEHGLSWDTAWSITGRTMAYTNHTLLPEALELWSVEMFQRLLPRLLEIIYHINEIFLAEVASRWPDDAGRLARMSLIQDGPVPMVRMAYLAIVGSYSVNGVAELHSRLLRGGLFRDFAEMWPERFNNKTNGVTQRRWLLACNPDLGRLVTGRIGDRWITDLEELGKLRPLADDAGFRREWRAVKHANKVRLAQALESAAGIVVDPALMLDVQVKRIHEYKRQVLNVLHAIHLYDRIRRGDGDSVVPRLILLGGKAAPGYFMAKTIIKLIHNVAGVINAEPATAGRLQMVFFPDYGVSAMELICPAADLSEQISTAGREASGTGNMKLMMNGALTIGTLDGANIEIREAVGEANFFQFGLTVEEIDALRNSYDPNALIAADENFERVMLLLESGHFNAGEPGIFDAISASIRSPDDAWMTAADFSGFVAAQEAVDTAYGDADGWTRMSILNTAASGRFSADRTIRDYNEEIWHLQPVRPATS